MRCIYNEIKQLSFKDPLTGLYNRRYLEEYLNNFLKEVKRGKRTFILALIDIDYFKKINDIYGHNIGDKLLQWFSNLLKNNLRDVDIIGRYGGDEFVVLFLDMTNEEIEKFATTIQCKLKTYQANFTVSQGYANTIPQLQMKQWDYLTKADEMLYQVKKRDGDNFQLYRR